ncbi:MAG: 16S rRNA (cytosine(967)-C(5))-methyltransferase RsmB [Bdellovibrio bacteriovorus]
MRKGSGADSRAAAAIALHRVRDRGQSLSRVLVQSPLPHPPADRALTQELVYGALRCLPRLEALVGFLLNHPVKPSDRDLESLILIGLYQLTGMDMPPHAAVAATVEASRLIGKPDKAPLVNALLRRFLRERDALMAQAERLPSVRWLFPEWLLAALRRDWPEDWEAIVSASNQRPPMSLRVNRLRGDRRSYAERLAAVGLTARPIPATELGLMLDRPLPARELPGFEEGLVSIQDGGAQLAAHLLDARPGQRVLDACAAPGGKTAAILERAGPGLDLVAVDTDPARVATLKENLTRLGLSARVERGDAAEPRGHSAGDWAATPFDRILLDVPCSATGVIRRHPDIKWLRRAADIPALCALQGRMLDAAWGLLVPGGRLLYATCSLLAAENQDQVAAFLARTPGARELPLGGDWGLARSHGRQLLPTVGGSDGFYYALLEKPSVERGAT